MHGRKSHRVVERGIEALCNLEHRGAAGAEVNTGDGAGILIQMPDAFLRAVVGFELPPAGAYATGIGFLPQDPAEATQAQEAIATVVESEGLTVLGWRDVPVVDDMLGKGAADVEPTFRQLLSAATATSRPPWTSSGGRSSCASGSSTRSAGAPTPPATPRSTSRASAAGR